MQFAVRKHLKGSSFKEDEYINVDILDSIGDTCIKIFGDDPSGLFLSASAYSALNRGDVFENGLHQYSLVKRVKFSIDQLWSNTVEAAKGINEPEKVYQGYLDLADFRVYQKGVEYAVAQAVIATIESMK